MTLVISKKINSVVDPTRKTIVIFGDTRLSQGEKRDPQKLSPEEGVIKTNIIHGNLAISWAGNSECADQFFKQYAHSFEEMGKKEIIDCVHNFSKKNPEDNDFIICFGQLEKEQEVEIVSIKNGNIQRNCDWAWIGSKKAYRQFNKKRIEYSGIMDEQIAIKRAMEEVLDSDADSSVGDFLIYVPYLLDRQSFLFSPMFKSFAIQKFSSGLNRIIIGDASTGSYTISLNPCIDNKKFLAFYFNQGRVGWLFAIPEEGGIMQIKENIKNVSPVEFEVAVLERHGLKIEVCYK